MLLACVAVAVGLLVVDPVLYERLSSVFTKVDTSSEMRLAFWESTICCWAWSDSPSENFTGGNWPGVACELLGTAANGNKVWKWTWDGKKQKGSSANQPAKIIFNNSGQPQTEDLDFTQAGYYNEEGLQGVVTATGIMGLRSQETGDRRQESGVRSREWYDLQGRRMNGYPTKKGIYIHNGKKTVIK